MILQEKPCFIQNYCYIFQVLFLGRFPFALIFDRVKQLCKRYQWYLQDNPEPSATTIFGVLCAKGVFQCTEQSNALGRHRKCLRHSSELCHRHSDLTNMCVVSNTSCSVLNPTFVRILSTLHLKDSQDAQVTQVHTVILKLCHLYVFAKEKACREAEKEPLHILNSALKLECVLTFN